MATIRHAKTSMVPDAGDATLVQPSDWNADHTVTGVPETGTVTVDFGATGSMASATFSASWVTSTSLIVVSPAGATADHDAEDVLIEEIKAAVTSVADGSCVVTAFAPGGTWGQYAFNIVGV